MISTSTKELKVFKEPGVIAKEARWYFAQERGRDNKITLRQAIRLMLSQCEHLTNEDTVYEIAVGMSICRKREAKKQKQIRSAHLQPVQSATTPRSPVRERLPYKDSDD